MSLKHYRELSKLTQQQLAALSGVKQQAISLIERSPSPNVELKTARALVSALQKHVACDLDQVFPDNGLSTAAPDALKSKAA